GWYSKATNGSSKDRKRIGRESPMLSLRETRCATRYNLGSMRCPKVRSTRQTLHRSHSGTKLRRDLANWTKPLLEQGSESVQHRTLRRTDHQGPQVDRRIPGRVPAIVRQGQCRLGRS